MFARCWKTAEIRCVSKVMGRMLTKYRYVREYNKRILSRRKGMLRRSVPMKSRALFLAIMLVLAISLSGSALAQDNQSSDNQKQTTSDTQQSQTSPQQPSAQGTSQGQVNTTDQSQTTSPDQSKAADQSKTSDQTKNTAADQTDP